MIYCQISNSSEVFLYSHDGVIECFQCLLTPTSKQNMNELGIMLGENPKDSPEMFDEIECHGSVVLTNRTEAKNHLLAHSIAGHVVPPSAFTKLDYELEKMGDAISDADADNMVDL